jgi:hypothetical protein
MSDLAEQILAAIAVREAKATGALRGETLTESVWEAVLRTVRNVLVAHLRGYREAALDFLDDNPPEVVLRRCAADREIVAEVMSWKHFYLDGDTWYSCGLSVDPSVADDEPGSGCANDDDKGHCTCGLEYRQRKIFDPLARGYGIQP